VSPPSSFGSTGALWGWTWDQHCSPMWHNVCLKVILPLNYLQMFLTFPPPPTTLSF
jgi:hypothetical protein